MRRPVDGGLRSGAARLKQKVGLDPLFFVYGTEVSVWRGMLAALKVNGGNVNGIDEVFMKGSDLLRIVDQMHHEKNIDREIIFSGIEAALQLAAQKKYGEETVVAVTIDRDSGEIQAKKGEETIVAEELGRIAAQSAKQV